MTINMTKKVINNLIAYTMVAFLVSTFVIRRANAACITTYGGGEYCVYNKRFTINKRVRIEGDSKWQDKVTDVKIGDVIEFKIEIINTSDEEIGKFSDMKMKDYLPEELERTGGNKLTEYWNDFKPGDSKTFIIKAKIDKAEFDRSDSFEKCVVNKAEVTWDGEFEGADTATVCYGDTQLTELPETGGELLVGFGGVVLTGLGFFLRKILS